MDQKLAVWLINWSICSSKFSLPRHTSVAGWQLLVGENTVWRRLTAGGFPHLHRCSLWLENHKLVKWVDLAKSFQVNRFPLSYVSNTCWSSVCSYSRQQKQFKFRFKVISSQLKLAVGCLVCVLHALFALSWNLTRKSDYVNCLVFLSVVSVCACLDLCSMFFFLFSYLLSSCAAIHVLNFTFQSATETQPAQPSSSLFDPQSLICTDVTLNKWEVSELFVLFF